MSNNYKMLDIITIISFGVGIYALYIALENLKMNDEQNGELKNILHYLEKHLQDQDKHLASQDRILENITEGGNNGIRR